MLTDKQVASLHKTFANKLSANTKWPQTGIFKIIQSGGFLGRLLGPLMKIVLSLMRKVVQPLAKRALITLRATAVTLGKDSRIHIQKFSVWGRQH